MFKQIANSDGGDYIEFWKFDVFGVLRNVPKSKTCKQMKKNNKPNIFIISFFISA